MAKVARGALKVINVVATIASFIPGPHQPIAAAVAATSSVALQVTAKKPRSPGTANDFRFDPNAGIPYSFGRTFIAGNVVHTDAYGKDNQLQSYVTVWSGGGPIQSIETILVDRVPTTFSSFEAVGYYNDFMFLRTQMGATPEGSYIPSPSVGGVSMPSWGAAHKLSGYAAGLWTLKFDKKGKKYSVGAPEFGAVIQGVKVYDPRLDSSYPGGSGACRALNEATYVYSANPALHALTYALGRWQNGKRVMGVGVPVNQIDVAAYAEAANVADANGWTIAGSCTSLDDKWNVLKLMLQCGAAEPKRLGAKLSCLVSAPKVSLATITGADLADGELSAPGMQRRRERFNTITPRYRSEAHGWEIIPASAIPVATYVAEDGGSRLRETEFPYVTDLNQAAELGVYEVANSREYGPIVLPLKPRWMGYVPGDCVTIDIPEEGLFAQRVIIIKRALDPLTGAVTMSFKSETDAKHAFALGQTGTAPPSPTLGLPILDVVAPEVGAWSAIGTQFSDNGVAIPAIVVTGAADNGTAEAVIFEFRVAGVSAWTVAGTEDAEVTRFEITGVTPGTVYDVAVSYRLRGVVGERRVLAAVTAGDFEGIEGPQGAPGAPGDNGLTIPPAVPPLVQVACLSDGTPKSGELPDTAQLKVFEGAADVTESCTFVLTPVDCTASVSNSAGTRGLITFTAIVDDDGYADVEISYGALDATARVPIKKVLDGATPGPSLSAATITDGTTDYPDPIALGPGETLSVEARFRTLGDTVSGFNSMQVQIAPVGGAFSVMTSGSASYTGGAGDPVTLGVSAATFTNGGASTQTYALRVVIVNGQGGTERPELCFVKAGI